MKSIFVDLLNFAVWQFTKYDNSSYIYILNLSSPHVFYILPIQKFYEVLSQIILFKEEIISICSSSIISYLHTSNTFKKLWLFISRLKKPKCLPITSRLYLRTSITTSMGTQNIYLVLSLISCQTTTQF